jgi:uncharacterized protein YceH (UPF0502 family)
MSPFADLGAVQEALAGMVEAGHVERHPRRPGQKEDRYEQVIGGRGSEAGEDEEPAPPAEAPAAPVEVPEPRPEADRLGQLERELAELRAQVAALREALGETNPPE